MNCVLAGCESRPFGSTTFLRGEVRVGTPGQHFGRYTVYEVSLTGLQRAETLANWRPMLPRHFRSPLSSILNSPRNGRLGALHKPGWRDKQEGES